LNTFGFILFEYPSPHKKNTQIKPPSCPQQQQQQQKKNPSLIPAA